MLDAVSRRMRQLRDGRKVLWHYLRWPYPIYNSMKFDSFNHEHTCIAARFANVDLADLCPLSSRKRMIPGSCDECETCQYFGTVYYRFDTEMGKRQLHLGLNRGVVTMLPPLE